VRGIINFAVYLFGFCVGLKCHSKCLTNKQRKSLTYDVWKIYFDTFGIYKQNNIICCCQFGICCIFNLLLLSKINFLLLLCIGIWN